MPGTTPDYWQAADDRLTATMLAVLDLEAGERKRARARAKSKRR